MTESFVQVSDVLRNLQQFDYFSPQEEGGSSLALNSWFLAPINKSWRQARFEPGSTSFVFAEATVPGATQFSEFSEVTWENHAVVLTIWQKGKTQPPGNCALWFSEMNRTFFRRALKFFGRTWIHRQVKQKIPNYCDNPRWKKFFLRMERPRNSNNSHRLGSLSQANYKLGKFPGKTRTYPNPSLRGRTARYGKKRLSRQFRCWCVSRKME